MKKLLFSLSVLTLSVAAIAQEADLIFVDGKPAATNTKGFKMGVANKDILLAMGAVGEFTKFENYWTLTVNANTRVPIDVPENTPILIKDGKDKVYELNTKFHSTYEFVGTYSLGASGMADLYRASFTLFLSDEIVNAIRESGLVKVRLIMGSSKYDWDFKAKRSIKAFNMVDEISLETSVQQDNSDF